MFIKEKQEKDLFKKGIIETNIYKGSIRKSLFSRNTKCILRLLPGKVSDLKVCKMFQDL